MSQASANRSKSTKSTAIRILEERLEELEAENDSLREDRDYYANVTKNFRDQLSEVEFDEDEDEDDDEDGDEDEDEDDDAVDGEIEEDEEN